MNTIKKLIAVCLGSFILTLLISSNEVYAGELAYPPEDMMSNAMVEGTPVVLNIPGYEEWKSSNKVQTNQVPLRDYSYIVKWQPDVDLMDVVEVYLYLDKIPACILEYMEANGWVFHLYTGDLAVFYEGYANIAGLTNFGSKVIQVSTTMNLTPGEILVHEIGHVLHKKMLKTEINQLTCNDVNSVHLQNVYYHDRGNTTYTRLHHDEMVAQLLWEYLFYPFEMNEVTPELFTIFNAKLQKY